MVLSINMGTHLLWSLLKEAANTVKKLDIIHSVSGILPRPGHLCGLQSANQTSA